jgi:hypothetical protein
LSKENGCVQLEVGMPVARLITFTFIPARLAPFVSEGERLESQAVRHAMAQARKLNASALMDRDVGPVELELSAHPWVGDLMSRPYGGATFGVESRAKKRPDRGNPGARDRRSDRSACQLVERAVDVQKAHGEHVAKAMLNREGIPDHIALRVVSCAAFRRKRS